MSLIKGIHHVAMKCCNKEEFDKTVDFYTNVLELEIAREWDNGIMFTAGTSLIEVFKNGESQLPQGTVRHFAFATDNVDACVEAVNKAGYPCFKGPLDIVIGSEIPFPARIAFCFGPLGEEIEFFQER